jgi:hypothetical protein
MTEQAYRLREAITAAIEHAGFSTDREEVIEAALREVSKALLTLDVTNAVATAIYGGTPDAYDVDIRPIARGVILTALRASGIERGNEHG